MSIFTTLVKTVHVTIKVSSDYYSDIVVAESTGDVVIGHDAPPGVGFRDVRQSMKLVTSFLVYTATQQNCCRRMVYSALPQILLRPTLHLRKNIQQPFNLP
jgi:hypothetical protein